DNTLIPEWRCPVKRTVQETWQCRADDLNVHTSICELHPCGFARVVFQEPSEPFTTLNGTCTRCVWANRRKEEHVALALMIPLVMKMLHVLRQHMAKRGFPKQDEPRQALFLDRSDPPLRVGVEIRRPWRQGHTRHSC